MEAQAALYAALSKAQAEVKAAGKSGHNSHGRYDYADADDLLSAAKPALERNGLSLVPGKVTLCELSTGQTSSGKTENRVHLIWGWSVLHKDGGRWDFEVIACGHDTGDKAHYKAETGAQKYALRTALGMPLREDPEKDQPQGNAQEAYGTGRVHALRALCPKPHPEWDEQAFLAALEPTKMKRSDLALFLAWRGTKQPQQRSREDLAALLDSIKTPKFQNLFAEFKAIMEKSC